MEGKAEYKFLGNNPKGEDLFEGKSQDKIANVLSDLLQRENFQILGIDGGWGTGKSNLVKIVQNKLQTHSFFIYDVWGHQEDDQRRAILVELTEFISDDKAKVVSDTNKWKAKLKRLLSKEKEVTTINNPYLSVGFIFSLFSIIYVPSINVFKDDLTDYFGIEKVFWKLVLVLLPIFIVIAIYLYNLVKCWLNKGGFWRSFVLASQETFQVYTNKQKQETRIETISENEPSVKDFRSWMREIDKDLGKKKLVLVFDNFDRLPKRHIISIWSSIHVFFSEDKYSNIKVIIPFDRLHIKNAFKELNGENKDYADDYINKTFDLVYRVSPPILSDWKIFFKKCWSDAFSLVDEEEYLKVEQIYEVFRSTITPREIIAFINEIVSIKLLDSEIPDKYLALFVLNKDVILENPLKAITEADFLGGLSYLYKEDEDFQRYITALAYQINPENALEVIYRKQVKDCLINRKTELLIKVSQTKVFTKILLPVVSEIDNYENPILILNEITEEAEISDIELQNVWDNIYLKIKNSFFVDFAFPYYQSILLSKLKLKNKKEFITNLISHLINHKAFIAVEYAKILDEIENYLDENDEIDLFKLITEKVTSFEDFIPFVEAKKQAYKKYKLSCDPNKLDEHLSKIEVDNLQNADFVEFITDKYKTPKFEKSLRENILEYKLDKERLENLYKKLKVITNKIDFILTDSDIYSSFILTTQDDYIYYDLIAMRLARGTSFSSSYSSVFDEALESDNADLIKKVSRNIEYYEDFGDILINSLTFPESDLYKAVVNDIVNNRYRKRTANIKNLLLKFKDICETNNLDPQLFLNTLDLWDFKDLKVNTFNQLSNFYYEESVKNSTDLAKTSLRFINQYFEDFKKEDWLTIFGNLNSKDAKLLNIIEFKNWNSHSLEALKENLISIVEKGTISNGSELRSIITSFEHITMDLTNSFKDVRDELINRRNINNELFSFFIPYLIKYNVLEDRAGDVVRTILKVEFLDDPVNFEIIENNINALKNIMANSRENDINDFKEGIRDRIENERIGELAKSLGIRKRKIKNEDEKTE